MSTGLQTLNATNVVIWDDPHKLEEIRKLFAPALTNSEFEIYVGMGKATGLNPFLKEIWAVKYGKDKDNKENPAQIFIGRDGYRKSAQAHPEYDYHQCDAVYENDEYQPNNGDVIHKYNLKNRGKLLGAYCIAKRHKSSRPHHVFVELDEYSNGQSLWAEPKWKDNSYGGKYKTGGKPSTMIKKVAEAQCLRFAFQELFAGTYCEEEFTREEIEVIDANTGKKLSKSEILENKLKEAKCHVIDSTPVEAKEEQEETGEVANPEQMKDLHALIAVKGFSNGRLQKAMEYYGIETLGQLTSSQVEHFIGRLRKEEDK